MLLIMQVAALIKSINVVKAFDLDIWLAQQMHVEEGSHLGHSTLESEIGLLIG